jgi:hypothetical protein
MKRTRQILVEIGERAWSQLDISVRKGHIYAGGPSNDDLGRTIWSDQMFTPTQYRARANEYSELIKGTNKPIDNADWMANNSSKTVHREDAPITLTEEEGHILRCLGASVIMQWNTLPRKLQRELFENASSVGELLQTGAFKQQMARFLHKHKNDEAGFKA